MNAHHNTDALKLKSTSTPDAVPSYLNEALELQRAAYLKDTTPSYEQRKADLLSLKAMILSLIHI